MTTITVAKRIDAPVDRVFELFTDIEHIPERVSGIHRIEVVTSGGFRLGTRWRETREIMGHHVTEEMEITAFERNRTFTITNDNRGTRVDTQFRFALVNRATTVSVECTLDPQSFPARLLSPIGWALEGTIREAIARDLDDLKRAVESRGLPVAG
jgi:uncharacterized protein YndB with AHSA1/START domain